MTQMLELADREFKMTMINIVYALMRKKKKGTIKDQIGNFSPEMRTISNYSNQNARIKENSSKDK